MADDDYAIVAAALDGISDASVRIAAAAAFRRINSTIQEDAIESLEGEVHESFESLQAQMKAVETAITTRSELSRELGGVGERIGSIGSRLEYLVELLNALGDRVRKTSEPSKPKLRRKRR